MAQVVNEESTLNDIKRLLILQLLLTGASQAQIAVMLGVSEATMSRMLPKGLNQAIRKERSQK